MEASKNMDKVQGIDFRPFTKENSLTYLLKDGEMRFIREEVKSFLHLSYNIRSTAFHCYDANER